MDGMVNMFYHEYILDNIHGEKKVVALTWCNVLIYCHSFLIKADKIKGVL